MHTHAPWIILALSRQESTAEKKSFLLNFCHFFPAALVVNRTGNTVSLFRSLAMPLHRLQLIALALILTWAPARAASLAGGTLSRAATAQADVPENPAQ